MESFYLSHLPPLPLELDALREQAEDKKSDMIDAENVVLFATRNTGGVTRSWAALLRDQATTDYKQAETTYNRAFAEWINTLPRV